MNISFLSVFGSKTFTLNLQSKYFPSFGSAIVLFAHNQHYAREDTIQKWEKRIIKNYIRITDVCTFLPSCSSTKYAHPFKNFDNFQHPDLNKMQIQWNTLKTDETNQDKKTHKNNAYFNWFVISFPRFTPSSTQNIGKIISGMDFMISICSIGFISKLNCIRLKADTGVPVIY